MGNVFMRVLKTRLLFLQDKKLACNYSYKTVDICGHVVIWIIKYITCLAHLNATFCLFVLFAVVGEVPLCVCVSVWGGAEATPPPGMSTGAK